MEIEVLYEDKDLLVVIKPGGVPSQADKTGDDDVTSFLLNKYSGEINIINRLDRPVAGIMLFARNKNAARILSGQIQQNTIKKEYHLVICGMPKNPTGNMEDYLLKEAKTNTSKVVSKGVKSAKEARLEYEVIEIIKDEEFESLALVKIRLLTGRHHQIRVQFSERGIPIWGDTKYNPSFKNRREFSLIALCSTHIDFKHPNGKRMSFSLCPKDGIFEIFKR